MWKFLVIPVTAALFAFLTPRNFKQKPMVFCSAALGILVGFSILIYNLD